MKRLVLAAIESAEQTTYGATTHEVITAEVTSQ